MEFNETEKFSSLLEEFIRRWKLSLDQLDDLKLEKERSPLIVEDLKGLKIPFKISLFENDNSIRLSNHKQCDKKRLFDSVLDSIKEVNYIFPNDTNFIQKIHHLSNFILIQAENQFNVLKTEDLIRLYNGAISCSIINTKCIVPIFLQIMNPNLNLSNGIFINFGIRINYNSAIFDLDQFDSSTIGNFLKIFENKLNCSLQLENNVRSFLANRRRMTIYRMQLNKEENFFVDLPEILAKEFRELELLSHLQTLKFHIEHTETLRKIQGTQWTYSTDQSILRDFDKLEDGCLKIEIDRYVNSPVFESSFFSLMSIRLLENINWSKMTGTDLRKIMLHEESFNDYYFENKQNNLNYFLAKSQSSDDFIDNNYVHFKSTSFDSIIFRFANFVFHKYPTYLRNETSKVRLEIFTEINEYWFAIVDQLRRYWELTELIPCVEDRSPDLNSCLLMQKIQMLNCCIKEKQRRENSFLTQSKDDRNQKEDEFFDCKTDLSHDDQAEGRLEKLNLTLLNNKMKPIYRPITQELPPYTQDTQEEYLNAYSVRNLNDETLKNVEDSNQFLVGKNTLLASDMEAFKAANPECCFEDFIRWYSPKDFIEAKYDEQTGQLLTREELSERFRSTDCLWREIWQTSKPIPICKQKRRIFNYSMEAERILSFLDSLSYTRLIVYLSSTLLHIGCLKYKQIIDHIPLKSAELSTYFDQQIKQMADYSKILRIDKTVKLLKDLDKKVFDHLGRMYLLRHTSFFRANYRRLNPFSQFELLRGDDGESSNETNDNQLSDKRLSDKQLNKILDEIAKNKLYRIRKDEEMDSIVFNGLKRLFDYEFLGHFYHSYVQSKEKEFTLVADCSRPTKNSRKLPQKLNFKVSSTDKSEKCTVQMNGQLSEDIVYF